MTDDTNPTDTLQRFNSRIGKTDDPFGRMKLMELRDQLKQAIMEAQGRRRQYRLANAGQEDVSGDWATEQVQALGEALTEANEQATHMAALFDDLLDVSAENPDVDLVEYIQAKQREQMEAQQAQLLAQQN